MATNFIESNEPLLKLFPDGADVAFQNMCFKKMPVLGFYTKVRDRGRHFSANEMRPEILMAGYPYIVELEYGVKLYAHPVKTTRYTRNQVDVTLYELYNHPYLDTLGDHFGRFTWEQDATENKMNLFLQISPLPRTESPEK